MLPPKMGNHMTKLLSFKTSLSLAQTSLPLLNSDFTVSYKSSWQKDKGCNLELDSAVTTSNKTVNESQLSYVKSAHIAKLTALTRTYTI